MVMIAIRMVIIENYLLPMHDPGITVWWLCCIKFGQKGKYSEKMIKEKYWAQKEKQKMMDNYLEKEMPLT